ncbi:MAG: hypothetical protein ACI867_001761 [Glaciecola sp.]
MSERQRTARSDFRVLTRIRGGYDGAVMYDIQLQVAATGALLWAQTFSDQTQANEFEAQVLDDMDELDLPEFRRKYSVPASAA